jgi:hypothetical protein
MAEASEAYYYVDSGRIRQGPFAEADIVRLINGGTIGRESSIWSAELTDWRAAGQVEKFAPLFARQIPPPIPSATYVAVSPAGAPVPLGNLTADFPVWGLFWRALLVWLGNLVIIPAPWIYTSYYRFLGTHTALPDGRRFTFAGQPGDIWLVFVGIAILALVGMFSGLFSLITGIASLALTVLVIRWFCSKLGTEDGSVQLTFAGGIWNYIGWIVLLYLSFITIIGWAWVLKALTRWVCQNVRGTLAFDFVGSGGAILGRTLLVALASMLIIPIPWMMRWYAVWFVSQIQVTQVRA